VADTGGGRPPGSIPVIVARSISTACGSWVDLGVENATGLIGAGLVGPGLDDDANELSP
jgi:hypothetical protein